MKINSYHRQNIVFQNFSRSFLSIGDEQMDYTRSLGLWDVKQKNQNSYDGGKSYKTEEPFYTLSKCSFYLSYERKNNIMKINDILQVLSEVGGLFNTIFIVLGGMGFFVNQRIMMVKFIRNMFYIQNPDVKLSINSSISDVNAPFNNE